jgi:nucleoside-specific channel-forming protein
MGLGRMKKLKGSRGDSTLSARLAASRNASRIAVSRTSIAISAIWSVSAWASGVDAAAPVAASAADSAGSVISVPVLASDNSTGAAPAAAAGPSIAAGSVPVAAAVAAPATSQPWLHSTLSLINSSLTRFGPYRTGNTYLEYEYFGSKGPFTIYGYVDALKVINVGTQNTSGVWDKGAPIFSEQEPRLALDTLAGKEFQLGPFKHIYLAADWIYEMGGSRSSAQNTLYTGLGTDIDTHTPLALSANIYVSRQFQNYGAPNEYSWDGYRFQMNYFYFLGHAMGGDWSYAGFFNYDFGSKLREKAGGNIYADTEFDETNALIYSRGHLRLVGVARYFHNGGQWNSSVLNFGKGNFQNRSTGWGYYLEAGYQWGK